MNKILRLIIGLVFLLSGLLKAIDTAVFADLISAYGYIWFGFAAPVIIAIEILLGMLLIFNISPHVTVFSTVVFILAVSIIFLYGILFRDITDCGCFGPLTFLNSKPWLTFTRNGILILLLIPSLFKQQQGDQLTMPIVVCMAVVAVVVMFMCGFTYKGAKCFQHEERPFQKMAVADSGLSSVVSLQPDSTYFIFAFSYDCPYCMNAVANVNQYTQMHAVDRVIGLAVNEPKKEERFHRLFETNFEIYNISPVAMYQIARTLPVGFLIRNDSIVRKFDGIIVSPALFVK